MKSAFDQIVRKARRGGHHRQELDRDACLKAAREAAEAVYAQVRERHDAGESGAGAIRMLSDGVDNLLRGIFTLGMAAVPNARTLATRVARASNLLRTRVDVSMEGQSRDLLQSMNRRAYLQLRMQETVEGLSVVVLSYYLLGMVGYGLKGLKSAGLPVNVEIGTGLAIPLVIGAVYLGVRRLKRLVGHQKE